MSQDSGLEKGGVSAGQWGRQESEREDGTTEGLKGGVAY